MRNKILTIGLILGLVLTFGIFGVKAFGGGDIINSDGGTIIVNVEAGMYEAGLGGSTSDDWNVGGNLAVTGTSAFTGATAVETFTEGGGRVASSTVDATQLLDSTLFDVENYIDYTANINTTLTLPASSTMSAIVPNVGDRRTYTFRSATTTAAATITFAEGTGNDLQILEATGADLVLEGLDVAELTLVRKNDTNIIYLFKEYTEQ